MRSVLLALVVTMAVGAAATHAQGPTMMLPAGTAVSRDVAYVQPGHERQVLDLYVPAALPGPLPLVMLVHGGAWLGGDKAANPQVAWLVPVLVDAGYVVASVAHRLSHHAPFPAQLQDVKAALRWLRANAGRYGLDPERVGAWGESSGGHLVALLATTAGAAELEGELPAGAPDTRIRAAAVWYGPTDFLQMDAHRLPGGMLHDTPDSPESRLLAARISEVPERVRQANPVTWVSAAAPPFLLVHGDRDLLVPHHQSVLLRDALAAAGVPVTLRTLPGAGHGTAEFRTLEAARELVDFFGRHLAPGGR